MQTEYPCEQFLITVFSSSCGCRFSHSVPLPAQTCPCYPFHSVSTAACGALQEARYYLFFFFFSEVIFNLALFIHVACHAAPQKVPGVVIWNREPVARGPDCTLGCCYCWKQHMKSTVAWRIWFIIVVNPGFEHRVWDKKQHSPFNLQTSLCFLNAFNFFPLVSLPLKRCWLRYCPPPLV